MIKLITHIRTVLSLLSFVCATLGASAYSFQYDGIYYNITSSTNKTVEVTYKTLNATGYDTGYEDYVEIPATVPYGGNTYRVTAIGDNAFSGSSYLYGVDIPSSVTRIGEAAFFDCGINEIDIPNSVTYIGPRAFRMCRDLSRVILPNSLTSLSERVFSACTSLTSVDIPSSVTSIGIGAFHYTSLKSVTIPASVTYVGGASFSTLSTLKNVTCLTNIPPEASGSAFYYTDNIMKTSDGDRGYSEDDYMAGFYLTGTLTVPSPAAVSLYREADDWKDVRDIVPAHNYDFVVNGIYYNITGSNTVEVHGISNGYSGSLSIPSSVTNNGITYQVTGIGTDAFSRCSGLTSVTIPNSVTSIGDYAFSYCYALTSVTLPVSLTAIGDNVFTSCYSLTSITIPEGVTSIGNSAFMNCSALTSVTIPNLVTSIGVWAFRGCNALTSVTIGSSVTDIWQNAFLDCPNLTSVTCLADTPPTMANPGLFDDAVYSNATLYVPKGCKSAYQSADGWSQFTNIRELSYSFEVDGIYYNITGTYTVQVTFRTTGYNSYSGNVTIPSSVTYNGITYQVTAIYLNAFRNCSNLTSVTIPNSVTTIGANAFNNCSSLTSITIPSSVTTIGNYAFANSNALTSVTCYALTPPSMSNAFSSTVYSNATLYVPKGCKSAYQSANGWSQFITIQELTYSFEVDGIYYEITGTRSVKVTYKSGYNTYSGKVVIPAKVTHSGNTYTVTSIGATAFLNSVNLTSVVIPSTVTTIGSGAFRGCTGLTSVNCRATTPPTLYSDESFSATTYSNATLYVPLQGSDLYHQADGWKNFTQMYIRDYDFIDNGIAYRIGGSNTLSVTIKDFSYNGDHQEFYSGDVVIPGTVRYDGNTYRVTHIGGLAFVSCPSLTNLTLPETVSYIRSWAVMGNPNLKSLTCLAPVPPTLEDEAFGGSASYSEFSLFVPDASIQSYRDDGNWGQFTTIRPSLDYALNVGSGTVKFTSTGDYPWTNVVEGDRVYAISGNKGRHSTTSTMTATVTVGSGGSVSFEYKAWGEGPSYDVCVFSVDGNQKFSYSNKQNDWVNYY